MRKVFVIQKPRDLRHFDMAALEALGDTQWVLGFSPNLTDSERLKADFKRLLEAVESAAEDDLFVFLGGSPISNALFGAAVYASGKDTVKIAVYSRDVDTKSGARKLTGSYTITPMNWHFADEVEAAA